LTKDRSGDAVAALVSNAAQRPPTRSTAALCAVAGVGAFALWWMLASPAYVYSNDAFDYVQMGAQLANGDGFSTLQIFPRHVPFLAERGLLDGAWPNLHRYPLPTALNGFAGLFTADARSAAMWQSGLAYAASVSAFAFAARQFAPLALAALGTLLFAMDPTQIGGAFLGLTEGAGALWIVLIVGLCARPSGMTRRDAALAGVVCGLAWLTRTQLAVLLPLVLVTTGIRLRDRRAVGLAALTAGLTLAPWMLHIAWLTHDPFFSFSTSRNLALMAAPTDVDMLLHAPPTTAGVLAEWRDEIWHKIVDKQLSRVFSLRLLHPLFAEIPGFALIAAGLSALFTLRKNGPLVALSVGITAASFVAVSFAFHSPRFYDPLRSLPYLLLLAGTAAAVRWVHRTIPTLTPWRTGMFIVLLAAGTFAPEIREGPLPGRYRSVKPVRTEVLATLPTRLPSGTVVVSDLSAKVAIHAGMRTIRLPQEPEDLFTLDSEYGLVDAILLSPRVFSDEESDRTVFANYWKYSEATGSVAFKSHWEEVEPMSGDLRLFIRRSQ
jgi:hypothetical protein